LSHFSRSNKEDGLVKNSRWKARKNGEVRPLRALLLRDRNDEGEAQRRRWPFTRPSRKIAPPVIGAAKKGNLGIFHLKSDSTQDRREQSLPPPKPSLQPYGLKTGNRPQTGKRQPYSVLSRAGKIPGLFSHIGFLRRPVIPDFLSREKQSKHGPDLVDPCASALFPTDLPQPITKTGFRLPGHGRPAFSLFIPFGNSSCSIFYAPFWRRGGGNSRSRFPEKFFLPSGGSLLRFFHESWYKG
jgi:hypothetical protein